METCVAKQTGCPILVVEDDADLREMMVELLALEGFEPEAAGDGIEALDKLHDPATPLPHVIVLDLMMPRMDGWEFCRRRAEEPQLEGIPVVVLSAAPRLDVKAAAVVQKPFDYDRLVSTIRAHC